MAALGLGAAVLPVRRATALLALGLVLAIGLAGCGDGGSADDEAGASSDDAAPQRGGSVVVGIPQDIEGFHPANNRISINGLNMIKAIYDPMTVLDDEGIAQPYLVESLEPNDDFTEWTITMRDGIRFHNGDELTPEILASHIKAMQLSPLTQFTFGPVAAVVVVDEIAKVQLDEGEVTEEEYDVLRRQVVVAMEEPWSTFPSFLASYQTGFIAHPDFMNGETETPIGTGPFVFEEWVPGDQMSATRNDEYWREGLPYLDSVEFRVLSDPESRYQSVESGDIDLMITNSSTQVAELSTAEVPEGKVLLEEQGAGDEQMILFNSQSGPTADADVRRAIQLATDREALNEQLYEGFYEVADTPYRADSPWYADPGWPEPDAEAAAEIVEAWEAENGDLVIEVLVYDTVDDFDLAQAIQAQWAGAGIEMEIAGVDESGMLQRVPFGDFDAQMIKFMNGSDPDEHYPFWTPENVGGPGELSINFARYDSAVVGDALESARRTTDVEERRAAYASIWEDWAENGPYLFLFHTPYVLYGTDDVQGIEAFTTPDDAPAAGFTFGSVFLTEVWRGS